MPRTAGVWAFVLLLTGGPPASQAQAPPRAEGRGSRIALSTATVVVDPAEPSYVQYAARDLSVYLDQVRGTAISAVERSSASRTRVAIGLAAARTLGVELGALDDLRDDGFVIRSFDQAGGPVLAVAGRNPRGTNTGVATLLQLRSQAEAGSERAWAALERLGNPCSGAAGSQPQTLVLAHRALRGEDAGLRA